MRWSGGYGQEMSKNERRTVIEMGGGGGVERD